ncbi:metallopeptidase family protein [Patescibacteria group bacterium]
MNDSRFEKLVKIAVEDLPEDILRKMKNVAIVVEDFPTGEQLKKIGTRQSSFLLGLYEGVPQNTWGEGFGGNLPDKITIFRNSIEKFAHNPEDVKKLVRHVVWHEIGHHFGFDEEEIRKLERKWNSK